MRLLRAGDLGFLRFFRAFRALRILRAHRILSFYAPGSTRQLMAKALQIVSLLFVVTGLVHALEVSANMSLASKSIALTHSAGLAI
jgi:hypothetical protein